MPVALSKTIGAWVVLIAAVGLAACTTDDTGKACSNPNITFSKTPIVGETPVVQVVDVSRDESCQTFECLASAGLSPYCTRQCTFKAAAPKATACVSNANCVAPQQCYQGSCTNDDCPSGFWCQSVQSVGPLATQLYCVRQTGCTKNLDCGSVGTVSCVATGCYDSCYMDPNCTFHAQECSPMSALGCTCPQGLTSCPDASLSCQPPGAANAWPSDSVTQIGVCTPN